MIKKIFFALIIILINFLLCFLGFYFSYRYLDPLINNTHSPEPLIEVIAVVFFAIAGFILAYNSKKFRLIAIGVTTLTTVSVIFLFFSINKSLATKGEYESRKAMIKSSWSNDGFFLNIKCSNHSSLVEVSQEKWIDVDSVLVRIDQGFFGFRTITDDLTIIESSNCQTIEIDTTTLSNGHFNLGNDFAKRRCFTSAIQEYTVCLGTDSLNPTFYTHRATVYLAKKDYNSALIDFCAAAQIRHRITNPSDALTYATEMKRIIKHNDLSHITKAFSEAGNIYYLVDDLTHILFCLEKIQK